LVERPGDGMVLNLPGDRSHRGVWVFIA
jgi:hypothetical protein